MTDRSTIRILVCGGRDYTDEAAINRALDRLRDRIGVLIQGGASGADALAAKWARTNSVSILTFAADWKRHGKVAGPLRNRQMIEEGSPDAVVAFPGGRGTANMVALAESVGLPVWLPGVRKGDADA